MQNTGGGVKRIFVKVFGFSDVERHALNTVFRLSESRSQAYALWSVEAPDNAQVLLLDGDSWEAAIELAHPAHDSLKLIWVGAKPPAKAWRVFERPLRWAAVIEAMDQFYAPELLAPAAAAAAAIDIDFDLDLDAVATAPAPLDLDLDVDLTEADADGASTDPLPLQAPPPAAPDAVRTLVIDSDRDARLYMRAKLTTAGLPLVDEAASGAEAQQLLRFNLYKVVVLDLELADVNSWKLLRELASSRPPIEHVILTGHGLSFVDGWRGWFAGAAGSFAKPLHPVKLHHLLRKARRS